MPLPGFNPVEKAPPAGSTRQIATGASVAMLHQRISDLERRVSDNERGDLQWTGLTYPSTYWRTYITQAYPTSALQYPTFGVVKRNGWCSFVGLFASAIAWNGGVPATYQNMWQVPAGFRPGGYIMGMLYMYDSAAQKMLVSADLLPNGLFHMRYPETIAGTSNGNQQFGTTIFGSWPAVN